MNNFWNKIKKPIIGPAPMDGVTDAAFRYITDIYGHPDILITEFVSAEAIEKGANRVLHALSFHKTNTPVVAQLFGAHPKALYKAALVAAALGFSGIDINMGCPDKKVIEKGGGAALIKNPELAKQIINVVKQAMIDWLNGITLEKADIHQNILEYIHKSKNVHLIKRMYIPVSIKTRMGYDKIITKDWISYLIEAKPDTISLHARTLKQMYSGKADWEEIGKAAELCSRAKIIFLGNGDVRSVSEAKEKARKYHTQGILIGRACLGNPWIFSQKNPDLTERFRVLLEHARKFMEYRPDLTLLPMRKHFTWYCKGFNHSAVMRNELMKVKTMKELENILNRYLKMCILY